MNFIFVSLCDNDFRVVDALNHVHINAEHDLTEQDYKFFIVQYLVYFSAIRRINASFKPTPERLQHIYNYLNQNVKVTFEKTVPDVDHDCGSAVLDVSTGYAWAI